MSGGSTLTKTILILLNNKASLIGFAVNQCQNPTILQFTKKVCKRSLNVDHVTCSTRTKKELRKSSSLAHSFVKTAKWYKFAFHTKLLLVGQISSRCTSSKNRQSLFAKTNQSSDSAPHKTL